MQLCSLPKGSSQGLVTLCFLQAPCTKIKRSYDRRVFTCSKSTGRAHSQATLIQDQARGEPGPSALCTGSFFSACYWNWKRYTGSSNRGFGCTALYEHGGVSIDTGVVSRSCYLRQADKREQMLFPSGLTGHHDSLPSENSVAHLQWRCSAKETKLYLI